MKMGIIGGSGLYDIAGLINMRERSLTTPFGAPSDAYLCGQLEDTEVYFLPRHARGHRLLPSEINHRANICGFKMLGVDRIISISAVGSLKEELRPRDIILPDQYFDRTKSRTDHTYFGEGIVAHVSFGDPCCPEMRGFIARTIESLLQSTNMSNDGPKLQVGGTYVNMEGPAFSTKAESNSYRASGYDVIGMTSLGEAKLCREAEICYQPIAMITDYDCWHETEQEVSVEMIVGHLLANVALAKNLIRNLALTLPKERRCKCDRALDHAVLTSADYMPRQSREKLSFLLDKYYPRK